MTDDFEESLRETLGNAVPAPPVVPDRAAAARRYARRVRRTRIALAMGSAAVVVAAVVAIPAVLVSPSDPTAGLGLKTPGTATPPRGGPACPPPGQGTHATQVDAVPEDAVAARLCVGGTAAPVWSPREPLVTGLEDLARTVNALPPATPHGCIPEGSLPRFQLIFQYAGDRRVVVTGDLGCGYVDIGPSSRDGAQAVLQGYLGRLAEQRHGYGPPPSTAPPAACGAGFRAPTNAQFVVDGAALSLDDVRVCVVSNSPVGLETRAGRLTPAEIRVLNADFALHRQRNRPHGPRVTGCLSLLGGGIPTLEISGTSAWGDAVRLSGSCEVFSYIDRSGHWYWMPSPAVSTMLESAMHATGQLTGRLLAVGGPAGVPPRPLSGHLTLTVNGRESASWTVGRDGRFTGSVAPGRYQVVARSPQYNGGKTPCQPVHPYVTVRAGQTVYMHVLCQEK